MSERRTRPPRFGGRATPWGDLFDAACGGRAVGLVPASIASAQRWPALAFVEVTDIPGSDVAIAWNPAAVPASARHFIDLATTLAAGQPSRRRRGRGQDPGRIRATRGRRDGSATVMPWDCT
ncbi:hypothetical protein [Frankia sp. EAN1pec]|uniref:hypothetical protein n=1 Tax=Parafrankia sp. (strain EAN1pec) TaxID=298653 RepID=UPI000674DEAC